MKAKERIEELLERMQKQAEITRQLPLNLPDYPEVCGALRGQKKEFKAKVLAHLLSLHWKLGVLDSGVIDSYREAIGLTLKECGTVQGIMIKLLAKNLDEIWPK